MRKTKKVLALLVSLSMLATSGVFLTATAQVEAPNADKTSTEPLAEKDNLLPEAKEIEDISFADLGDHWVTPTVKMLAAGKYVQGVGDGKFLPEKNVTRAEFVTMAVNALRLEATKYAGCAKDITADKWFADTIETANVNGLLDAALFIDGNFSPDKDITREDASLIIAKAAESKDAKADSAAVSFTDSDSISAYAKDGVAKAFSFGLLAGYPDGSFKPQATLTRAEASELLVRTIEIGDRLAIYVDPENGDDKNDGTKNAPVASINAARELVKANNDDMENHLFVFLKAGDHYISEEIKMGEDESGSNGYNVVYTSYGEGKAQLMMGKHFSGFELADADLNIYKTKVGDIQSRQVFINDVRAIRAKSAGELTNAEMTDFGFYSDDTFLADYKSIKDLEFVTYSSWTQPRCGVSDVTVEEGRAKIVMDQPGWSNNSDNTPWKAPHWYENAYELLDMPGEWYIDSTDGYLYYIPRSFEDPKTMVATIPEGERMLTLEGTADEPIHNITFDDVEFAYTTWMRPSDEKGYNDGQNNFIDGGLPETAVLVKCARYIDFTNNKFSKLGAAALQMRYSIQECDVIGNEFADLSGTAVSLGNGPGDNYETEIKPTEYKYYTINNRINNNYMHDIGVDYGSSAAISASWPKYTEINHNEIANVNYSGMHIGYGWGTYAEDKEQAGTGLYKVQLNYNYIHDVMNSKLYDGGPIYTLGATGGTYENPNEWCNNYFENDRNAYGSVYPDEGSTFWLIENNVIDYNDVDQWNFDGRGNTTVPKWLHIHTTSIRYNTARNNYSTTAEKNLASPFNNIEEPMVYADGEWPEEAQNIIDEAGLEAKYLAKYPVSVQRFNLNQEEFVAKVGAKKQIEIEAFGRKQSVAKPDDYQVTYVSSDPSVAAVSETGEISVLSEGRVKVYVNVLADGIVRTKEIDVICGDELETVELATTGLTVIQDFESTISPKGTSKFGRSLAIEEVKYTVEDENVATVDEKGNVKGLAVGTTTIHGAFTVDGVTVEKDIPVNVITYSKEGSEKLPSTKLSGDFFNPENWKNAKATADGKGVAVTGNNSCYTKEKLADGLYSFDMRLDDPHSWPSLGFKIPDANKEYSGSDCYFIGFKTDHIEVQRFKDGERTMFLGASDFNPVGGPGVPNNGQVLEYGKTYHVTAGTIEEKDGVRIILTIDGKNIFDYLDNDKDALRGPGYMGVYVGGGTFTFSPYTGE